MKQYEGLKHSDDRHDAFWLAHLLRLAILPSGYIYPKAERGLRDLARQRTRLVQHRSAHLTSVQNQIWRSTGVKIAARALKDMGREAWPELTDEETRLSIDSARAVIATLGVQIERLEERLLARVKLAPEFRQLLSVSGIGPILALTIMLEVGDIRRFPSVGQFASYCRCVESKRISNGKKKGEANRKCGNPYLAWAFHEAAHFALRYLPPAKRFYERKRAARNQILAIRALAHKIARACYYVMCDQVPFAPERLFAA